MYRAGEDGERKGEERAHSSKASPDSFCRVMGLVGMGHRLFVPKLLAVRTNWEMHAEMKLGMQDGQV